ncbi:11783_t:CDS:1, partial [Ambispora leptoticha]
QGGFATVFYAKWLDKEQNFLRDISLKLIDGSKSYNEKFIKE